MYIRPCPTCNTELEYKTKQCLTQANKRNTKCYACAFSTRQKMSDSDRVAHQKTATRKYLLRLKHHVWAYLSTHSCISCGESNILFLEFHHQNNKTEWVSWLLRKHASLQKIDEEISKCDVLCIGCHRKHTRSMYPTENKRIRNSMQFIADYLVGKSCVDCGKTDSSALEFDHVRGAKFHNVSTLAGGGYSIARIREEIAKCDIVCCNCHRKRTASRGNWAILQYSSIKH